MREIKFRAWDNFTAKMLGNDEPLLWNRILPLASVKASERQAFRVMQYPGLTDRHGKE